MIRKTEEADREEVLAVYHDAKEYFRSHGIPQWQKGTPDGNTLHNDMQRGYSYVLEKDGKIVGTACRRIRIISASRKEDGSMRNRMW